VKFVTGEETRDELNNWYAVQRHNRRYAGNQPGSGKPLPIKVDVGGGFYNLKTKYEDTVKYLHYVSPEWPRYGYAFEGHVYPYSIGTDPADPVYKITDPAFTPATHLGLMSLGATAISRCSPTNPHADVAVGLAELYREGLPRIPGLETFKGKKPEGDFLNYQFGIAPLLSDLKAARDSFKKSRAILGQYYRDSGRGVRRRYSFEPKISSVSSTINGGTGGPRNPGPTYVWRDINKFQRVDFTTHRQETWFSGCFTYHARENDNSVLAKLDKMIQEGNILYGLSLNASVLWNLAPWSWLVDWMTNVGDVLKNVAMIQNDGLFMRYGYIMQHTVKTVSSMGRNYVASSGTVCDGDQRYTAEYKLRRRATPFGFGLDPVSFTGRQWAILAAVGISQGRGHL